MESVILHPLPLIAISDFVVRHTLRQQKGPIVGALFGQQNGREITIEFAFEVKIDGSSSSTWPSSEVTLDHDWFELRLDQMRMVHKDRSLDLVGWFTLLPRGTPGAHVLPIHNQIMQFNESPILLGLHTDDILEGSTGGGKLPLTIYESIYEIDDATKEEKTDGEDKQMKDSDAQQLNLKFRELPYSVETGEAEMISMDYIAGGAANAASTKVKDMKPFAVQADIKGKRRAVSIGSPESEPLPKEDEEMVAALTSKANAIKMLKSRLDALTTYLDKTTSDKTGPLQTVLRSTQGLVHRLSLVEPSNVEAFNQEMTSEINDVTTITLLNDIMNKLMDSRDIGKKFSVVEAAKRQKNPGNELGGGYTTMPSMGDLLM